jgi:hypothetical protein
LARKKPPIGRIDPGSSASFRAPLHGRQAPLLSHADWRWRERGTCDRPPARRNRPLRLRRPTRIRDIRAHAQARRKIKGPPRRAGERLWLSPPQSDPGAASGFGRHSQAMEAPVDEGLADRPIPIRRSHSRFTKCADIPLIVHIIH